MFPTNHRLQSVTIGLSLVDRSTGKILPWPMSVGCQGLERVADLVLDVLCADKQTGARPREARRGGEGQQVGSERQGGVDSSFFLQQFNLHCIYDHRPYFRWWRMKLCCCTSPEVKWAGSLEKLALPGETETIIFLFSRTSSSDLYFPWRWVFFRREIEEKSGAEVKVSEIFCTV